MARPVYWFYLGVCIAVFHYFCGCNKQFWHTRSTKDYARAYRFDVVLREASRQESSRSSTRAAKIPGSVLGYRSRSWAGDTLEANGVLNVRHRRLPRTQF